MAEPTYEIAVSSLLQKREWLLKELERLRQETAEVGNDVRAIERTLSVLGYTGKLDIVQPVKHRYMMFVRAELKKFILGQIREHGALASRELARAWAEAEGKDPHDEGMMVDLTKRVSKSVRNLVDNGTLRRERDKANRYVYSLKEG